MNHAEIERRWLGSESQTLLLLEEEEIRLREKISSTLSTIEGSRQHLVHLAKEKREAEAEREVAREAGANAALESWAWTTTGAERTGRRGIISNVAQIYARIGAIHDALRVSDSAAAAAAGVRNGASNAQAVHLCVHYLNDSCLFALNSLTSGSRNTYSNVLREAAEYWGVPLVGCALADERGRVLPLQMPVPPLLAARPPYTALVRYAPTAQAPPELPLMRYSHYVGENGGVQIVSPLRGFRKVRRRQEVGFNRCFRFFINLFLAFFFGASAWLRHGGSQGHTIHKALRESLFYPGSGLREGNISIAFNDISTTSQWWAWINGPLRAALVESNLPAACPATLPFQVGSITGGGVYCSAGNFTNASRACGGGGAAHSAVCTLIPALGTPEPACAARSMTMCSTAVGRFVVKEYNHLVGGVHLQQFRVNSICADDNERVDDLDFTSEQCFPKFDTSSRTSTDDPFSFFIDAKTKALPGFTNCEPSQIGAFSGTHDTWKLRTMGCGFGLPLAPVAEHFDDAVATLQANKWVDVQTRALIVTMNLYNPSVDLYSVVRAACKPKVGNAMDCAWNIEIIRLMEDLPFATNDTIWQKLRIVADAITLALSIATISYLLGEAFTSVRAHSRGTDKPNHSGDARGEKEPLLSTEPSRTAHGEEGDSAEEDGFIEEGDRSAGAFETFTALKEQGSMGKFLAILWWLGRKATQARDCGFWCFGMRGRGTMWNFLEFSAIGVVFMAYAPHALFFSASVEAKEAFRFSSDPKRYWATYDAALLSTRFRMVLNIDSVVLFLLLIKMLRYLTLNPDINRVFLAFRLASRPLLDFLYVTSVVFSAASMAAYTMFGPTSHLFGDYETVIATMFKLSTPTFKPDLPEGVYVSWRNAFQIFSIAVSLTCVLIVRGYVQAVLNYTFRTLLKEEEEVSHILLKGGAAKAEHNGEEQEVASDFDKILK